MNNYNQYAVIDLFCGIGGLSHGFQRVGFDVVAGYDIDSTCKYAFEKNNKAQYITKDIKNVSATELNGFYKDRKKILVGCAPCQPFSLYSNKNKSNNVDEKNKDDKWSLLYDFSAIINQVQPDIISMENVPQLKKFNAGKVLQDFIFNLERKNDYKVSYSIINAQDYGVPQRRKRLVLLASKLGEIQLLSPTHNKKNYITVRDAIGHLNKVEDGIPDPNDPLHFARKLSVLNKQRVIATKEGGFWRDWPDELRLTCHKKESGVSFRSVYGRMSWNDVAPTITTYCIGLGNGRFGHPEQDRAISLREAAIFQSFPEYYQFIDPERPISLTAIARHIGNAVPVKLGEVIAESIKQHLNKYERV